MSFADSPGPPTKERGEQRLAAADNLVGRSAPVSECHFHGLQWFSGIMAAVNTSDAIFLTTSVLLPLEDN